MKAPRIKLALLSTVAALASCMTGDGDTGTLMDMTATGSNIFIRDTASDTGAEPYAGPGPVYLSPDIWVRHDPDPNHSPDPFPTASPTWTPQPHQNPEHRDSKTAQPNYIYVRIHNNGTSATSGTERLRLYQAKASTGLAWPADWVDHVGNVCEPDQLLGIEVTKPRLNAQTAPQSVLDAYRDALLEIGTDARYQYSDGTQYWQKQNSVHATSGNPEHGNPAFLPWHREMLNRYEERLREADPTVTLLYWDWTDHPVTGTRNLFTTSFMGSSSGTVSTPLTPLQPPTLSRNVGASAFSPDPDNMINANGNYPDLAIDIEGSPNHNIAHGFIGGFSGQISSLGTAASDPFFFLLHGNVDRLWANWQRSGAQPIRIDPIGAYGADSSSASITSSLSPWDGATSQAPWSGVPYAKTSKHESIVYAPIYDTAPLNIPTLDPGESVVIEIPWYPPDVQSFNCAGDAGHFCLLARIETATSAPFGMTFPEGTSVYTNTVENNKIAWKNLTIVDDVSEPHALTAGTGFSTGAIVRNVLDTEGPVWIGFDMHPTLQRALAGDIAAVTLSSENDRFTRAVRRGQLKLVDFEPIEMNTGERLGLRVTGEDPRVMLELGPREMFVVNVDVDLDRELADTREDPLWIDIEQRFDREFAEEHAKDDEHLGGVRFLLAQQDDEETTTKNVGGSAQGFSITRATPGLAKELGSPDSVEHLSVGEPIRIEIDASKRNVSQRLLVDGRARSLREFDSGDAELVFRRPGIHTITLEWLDDNGEVVTGTRRVLVSEDIPPRVVIESPGNQQMFRVGQTIPVTVDASAAFDKEVIRVDLYAKVGDRIDTGLDLINDEGFEPVDSDSDAPYQMTYTPTVPGMHMLQVGATDSEGIVGRSSHVMFMVR